MTVGARRRIERKFGLVDQIGFVALAVAGGRTVLLAVNEPLVWMSEVGDLVNDVAIAIFTGAFLNWLVVERPRLHSQRRIYEAVGPRIQSLGGVGRALGQALARAASIDLEDAERGPSAAEWETIGHILRFESEMAGYAVRIERTSSGLVTVPQTVHGYVVAELARADRFVADIQEHAQFLEPELLVLVHAEQSASLRLVFGPPFLGSGPMEGTVESFIDYEAAGRRITDYYESEVRQHTSNRLPAEGR